MEGKCMVVRNMKDIIEKPYSVFTVYIFINNEVHFSLGNVLEKQTWTFSRQKRCIIKVPSLPRIQKPLSWFWKRRFVINIFKLIWTFHTALVVKNNRSRLPVTLRRSYIYNQQLFMISKRYVIYVYIYIWFQYRIYLTQSAEYLGRPC